jgi:hypothetical protein
VSHRKRNPGRALRTCEWFLRHEKYQQWRQEPKSSFLWISAGPGYGKSVLASFLVDELNNNLSQSTSPATVCFFFFKNDDDKQMSAKSALCGLLHQLFTTNTTLFKHATTELRNKGQKFMEEFNTLWKIFTKAVTDSSCGNIICVIDGLDECDESTRVLFINSLVKFHSTRGGLGTNNTVVKFIVSSRPHSSIESRLRELPRIKLEDETDAINTDISQFIGAKLNELASTKILSNSEQARLKKRLINNPNRTFLWVSLIFNLLRDTDSETKIKKIIDNLPGNLETVYEKILEQSPNPEKAKEILHLVLAAVRPLTLAELNVALGIRPDHKSVEDLRRNLHFSTDSAVKSLCGGFVKIIDSKIYLAHHTAKESWSNALTMPILG